MKGFQIKINGQWVYLPEDFTIDLEQTNPVFNDQGTFSFPFEIPLEPNREIFKNLTDPFGDRSLREIDKSETEIWFNDVMLYRGVIDTDDEVEFEDSLPVTFTSGNGDFMSRVENLKARDIQLDREIKLGYEVYKASGSVKLSVSESCYYSLYLPYENLMNYTAANISDPYPIKPYCNARICTPGDEGGYVVLDARRSYSGVCFYVMYLIDCMLQQLGISVQKNEMREVEDLCRLAFFSTACDVATKGDFNVSLDEITAFKGDSFSLDVEIQLKYNNSNRTYKQTAKDFTYTAREVYATENNFPDISVKDLLNDLWNAFGVRFVYSDRDPRLNIYLLRNIFRNTEIKTLDVDILEVKLVRQKNPGVKVTYGDTDDTSYNYSDYSNVVEKDNYMQILQVGQSAFDTSCYVDKTTGNAYRIKVDKDTGGNPALFEVGGYGDFTTENATDEAESREISFKPVAINDVDGKTATLLAQQGRQAQQELAVYVDETLKSDPDARISVLPVVWSELNMPLIQFTKATADVTLQDAENYDRSETQESPLRSYDAGYTLGIMRGPGNDSGVEIVTADYDGEGNSSWVQTVGNYAFTADSCDNYGRFFDYNGTETGGVDQSGRFSLKLSAQKEGLPIGDMYKGRGLVDKFLSEYLFFISNRKTLQLKVDISVAQILGIDFLKRYRIGPYTGFINKISYTLGMRGVENAIIELYTL